MMMLRCLVRIWSCRMRSLCVKTLAASTSSGGRSPASTATCTVLAGTTTGGCSGMSCRSCSMSAAYMQEGKCFISVARFWTSSSMSLSTLLVEIHWSVSVKIVVACISTLIWAQLNLTCPYKIRICNSIPSWHCVWQCCSGGTRVSRQAAFTSLS